MTNMDGIILCTCFYYAILIASIFKTLLIRYYKILGLKTHGLPLCLEQTLSPVPCSSPSHYQCLAILNYIFKVNFTASVPRLSLCPLHPSHTKRFTRLVHKISSLSDPSFPLPIPFIFYYWHSYSHFLYSHTWITFNRSDQIFYLKVYLIRI